MLIICVLCIIKILPWRVLIFFLLIVNTLRIVLTEISLIHLDNFRWVFGAMLICSHRNEFKNLSVCHQSRDYFFLILITVCKYLRVYYNCSINYIEDKNIQTLLDETLWCWWGGGVTKRLKLNLDGMCILEFLFVQYFQQSFCFKNIHSFQQSLMTLKQGLNQH